MISKCHTSVTTGVARPGRALSLLAAAGCLAAAAPSARAGIIFSEDFENKAVGVRPGTSGNGPFTASADNNTTVVFRVALDDTNRFGAGTGNKVLNTLDTASDAGGHVTATGFAGAAAVSTFSFEFFEPTRAAAGSSLFLQVGAGAVTTNANILFQYRLNNGVTTGNGAYTLDTPHRLDLVANNSSAVVSYTSPAGTTETVGSRQYDVFIDGVRVSNNFGPFGTTTVATGAALNSFNFQTFTADANQQVFIDDVRVFDAAGVPEPTAAAGVAGMAALAGLRRRRR